MKIGVSLTIDVTKLDKARFHEGKKGTYADMTVFIDVDEKDQYDNNGMIVQSVTEAERAAKVQGNILGNCRVFYKEDQRPERSQPQQPAPMPEADIEDDIPF